MLNKKGVVSIEFIFSLLIIIVILYLLILVNLNFKNKLSEEINYEEYNFEVCFIKEIILKNNNGEILNDFCKIKKRTNNYN